MGYPEAQYIIDEVRENIDIDISGNIESLLIASHAGIDLIGLVGMTFTLTNENTSTVKTHTLSVNDDTNEDGYKCKRIYVAPGSWVVETAIPGIGSDSNTIEATTVGTVYVFEYEIIEQITALTSTTSYVVPDTCCGSIAFDACGGGGGGGSGAGNTSWHNSWWTGGGGGGGGYAEVMHPKSIAVSAGEIVEITIGAGGSGGAAVSGGGVSGKNGGTGGATVIGNLITCSGGTGGGGGNAGTTKVNGTGGSGGIYGGDEGTTPKTTQQSAPGGAGGTGTMGGTGGSGGTGGDSASAGTGGAASGNGNGGGGGAAAICWLADAGGAGGAGSKGKVIVYNGVRIVA